MPSRRDVICWDSCVYISWLTNEKTRAPIEMAAIYECAKKIERGQIILLASIVIHTEVKLKTEDAKNKFQRLLKRSNVDVKDVDIRVSSLAGMISDYYIDLNKSGKGEKLKSFDSIHLATAIHYRADAFYTFDDRLLKLNGNIAGHNLILTRPPSPDQFVLPPVPTIKKEYK